jgi:hypothetical protein
MPCWFSAPIPWFSSGSTLAVDTLTAFEKAIAGGVRDAAPTFIVSLACPATVSLQGSVEVIHQSGSGEWLHSVPVRPQKIVGRGAHRCIIVNDGDDRKC